jgi:hypothetical protein
MTLLLLWTNCPISWPCMASINAARKALMPLSNKKLDESDYYNGLLTMELLYLVLYKFQQTSLSGQCEGMVYQRETKIQICENSKK